MGHLDISNIIWGWIVFLWLLYLHSKIAYLEREIESLKPKEELKDIAPIPKEIKEPSKEPLDYKKSKEKRQKAKSAFNLELIINKIFGGNVLVRIGGVILFFGLIFLAKYMAKHSNLSISSKLIVVGLIGLILTLFGYKLRDKKGSYGEVLEGIGVATLYLDIFVATKFYNLIAIKSAFLAMVAVVIFSTIITLIQGSKTLAIFSIIGGFLVPILIDFNSINFIFGYYLILDIAIFFISWFYSWRLLNILGFIFTYLIATAWGVLRYEPIYFNQVAIYWISFYLLYLAIGILNSYKEGFKLNGYLDITLIFGLPFVGFSIWLVLVKDIDNGALYSSLALGSLYLVLAISLSKTERLKLLAKAFIFLSAIFFTLSIIFHFSYRVGSSIWAIEGASLIYLGLRKDLPFIRVSGEILLLISAILGLKYIECHQIYQVTAPLITVISLFFSAMALSKRGLDIISVRAYLLFGAIYWFISLANPLNTLGVSWHFVYLSALVLGSFILLVIDKLFSWEKIVKIQSYYFFLAIILFILDHLSQYGVNHPFANGGEIYFTLIAIWGILLLFIYRDNLPHKEAITILWIWYINLILALEGYYFGSSYEESLLLALSPILFSSILLLKRFSLDYIQVALIGLNLALILGFFGLSQYKGEIGYVAPILNIIDSIQILIVAINFIYLKRVSSPIIRAISYLMALVLPALILARATYHLFGIKWSVEAIFNSAIFQSSLSLTYSLIAIALMVSSIRFKKRSFWIAGFSLLIAVVIKLLFIDLSSIKALYRVITFMGVGGMLLLIGYLAPLPPSSSSKS